jgi:integrase
MIETLPVPESGRVQYRDAQVRGLGLLIQSTGHRSFYWYKKVRNYPRWQTLGVFPDLTVEQARAAATDLNSKLAKWKASNYEGVNPFERGDTVETLDMLVDEYVARHLRDHAKNPDDAEYTLRYLIRKYMPSWRSRALTAIRAEDVEQLHRTIGKASGHRTANKIVQTLRRLFRFAKRTKMYHGDIPTDSVQYYDSNSRTRFLSPDELARLWRALREAPNPDLVDYTNLALWTGARKSDVLSMRWSDVAFDDNHWTIPNPKSGLSYIVPLTPEAVAILRARQRRRVGDSLYVFPGVGASGHIVDLKRGWKRLLIDAGLHFPGESELRVTQHDLRRTNASWQAAQGASLLVIGKSLGHSSVSSTQIYSRLDLGPVRASMESANAAMAAAMKRKPKQLKAGKAAPRE